MAKKITKEEKARKNAVPSKLRTGDPVMVISGGSGTKREVKGKTGKILKFVPSSNRVIVEGVNMVKRHKRAASNQDTAGIIEKEASVHISNVMYFVESLGRPVRLSAKVLDDGRKVRGFTHPESKKFEQVDVG